jgi:hypothetical protein
MLVDPGADQIARQVVALGQPVKRLVAETLLRDLALKLDAVGSVISAWAFLQKLGIPVNPTPLTGTGGPTPDRRPRLTSVWRQMPPVAFDAAIEHGDFSPFAELPTVLSRPYEDQAVLADYANPPHADERVFRTFCGT